MLKYQNLFVCICILSNEYHSLEKLKVITGAIEHILAFDKKQKEAFITTTLELMQSYSLCSTTQVAKKHNLEIGLLNVDWMGG
jgi:hypothetical protein